MSLIKDVLKKDSTAFINKVKERLSTMKKSHNEKIFKNLSKSIFGEQKDFGEPNYYNKCKNCGYEGAELVSPMQTCPKCGNPYDQKMNVTPDKANTKTNLKTDQA